MTVVGHLISVNGTHADISMGEGNLGEELNAAISCRTFDMVSLDHGIDAVVDDEGAIVQNPHLNLTLTIICHALGRRTAIFGHGILVGSTDMGETVSLTDAQKQIINRIFDHGVDDEITDAVTKTLRNIPNAPQLVRSAFV